MSATVGKIIHIKDWQYQRQHPEVITWENHKNLRIKLRAVLAVLGFAAIITDLIWLKFFFIAFFGIVALFPLFLSCFIYANMYVELNPPKGYLLISKQNKFYDKVLKISLKGITALEENVNDNKKTKNYLLLHLKNGESYRLALPKNETQTDTFKQSIIRHLGLGFQSKSLQKFVS